MQVRLEMNSQGAAELLKSREVQGELHRRAELIRQAAGGGDDFEVLDAVGNTRARSTVTTATFEGILAEATDRTLTKALDAGRG